jgi:flavin reductase (DIM6/NTAB) family NADH-FMN oxidoreductase RutF
MVATLEIFFITSSAPPVTSGGVQKHRVEVMTYVEAYGRCTVNRLEMAMHHPREGSNGQGKNTDMDRLSIKLSTLL